MMVTTLIETKLREIPEDWGVTTIGECCVILDSQRVPLSAEERRDMKGDYPYYGANGQVDSIDKWIFDEPLILMAEDGGYFDDFCNRPIAYKVTSKCWVNNHAHVLKPKEAYWFDWVFYQLEHMNVIPYINGSTRTKLNQQELVQIRLPVAPLPEQRKIAEILSTVDETIEKTDAIIHETQQLKKGLIQKLFTEGIGHTRFKETKIGRIPEEWEAVRLGKITQVRGGNGFPLEYQGSLTGSYPFYKVSDMTLPGNEVYMQSANNYVDSHVSRELRATIFPAQTVIFPKVGAAVYTNKKRILSCEALIDNNVMGVTVTAVDRCLPYFLYTYFQTLDLTTISNPGPLPSINAKRINSMEMPLPPLPEQRKIAQILSEVDLKTEREQAFKEELEQLKKGLMQVLLTGKVRVKV